MLQSNMEMHYAQKYPHLQKLHKDQQRINIDDPPSAKKISWGHKQLERPLHMDTQGANQGVS
jgi:hypothetical protein